MHDIAQQRFLSQTRGTLFFAGVVSDILLEANTHRGSRLKISVGTDSEEIGDVVKHVTIIHLWRVGRGARAYRTETIEPAQAVRRKGTSRFRDRIWREVMLTATLAQELRSALRDAYASDILDGIEVHADVGVNGGSSVMIREIIGVLKGYGFSDEFIKLKPDAYAASAVADHYI